jgi:toxin ParE1/3/4
VGFRRFLAQGTRVARKIAADLHEDCLVGEGGKDLLQIYAYLAERNERAADALIREFDVKFKNLSRFPFIGRERSSLAAGIRSILVGIHLIFYLVEREQIVIVRVIDGCMDIDEEFKR